MTQQYTLQEQEYGGSAWCGVPVYSSTFAVSHSNYLWSDDKTPLTWVASYTLRWFTWKQMVTYSST